MCQSLFFLVQAEDGIRDGHVTGVQTCALPIYTPAPAHILTHMAVICLVGGGGGVFARQRLGNGRAPGSQKRSEERRVGKERGWRGGTNQRKRTARIGAGRAGDKRGCCEEQNSR